jgi:hypothetical protein
VHRWSPSPIVLPPVYPLIIPLSIHVYFPVVMSVEHFGGSDSERCVLVNSNNNNNNNNNNKKKKKKKKKNNKHRATNPFG